MVHFKLICRMKQYLTILCAAFVSLTYFTGCEKEIKGSVNEAVAEHVITVNAYGEESVAPANVASKTYISGTSIKWASSGEKLEVFEVATPAEGEATTAHKTSEEGVTTDSGATMSFSVSMTEKEAASFDYYAIYPSSAYHKGNGSAVVTSIAVNTPASQTPTATSFDPAADLLIAKKVSTGTSQADALNMQFARAIAIGAMTIKNLESSDPITKVTFSAKHGDEAIYLAGRTAFNLDTQDLVSNYASNTHETSIILDYSSLSPSANSATGIPVYFVCYPFAINSETPGSFKVVVETATKTFTKEVSVNTAKGLAFKAGKVSTFSVDMDNIEGEDKAHDLCYAYLDFDDVKDQFGTGYVNISHTKAHGDIWSLNATNASNSIGLHKDDASSFIKLPDFVNNISNVVVTLAAEQGTGLSFDSTQEGNSGDIVSVNYTAGQLVYTVDLSSEEVKTAYIHSKGGQSHIAKVEVYCGTDTRTAVTAPTNVTAELNSESTTSIDVSWNAPSDENVGGYLISLTPGNYSSVVIGSNVTTGTIGGLATSTTYSVSVKSLPEDPYLYRESSASGNVSVTTGSNAVVFELYSGAITAGDYLIVYGDVAMKNTVSSDRLQYETITPNNNKITDPDASIIWHIDAEGDYWTVYNESIEKYAVSTGAKNKAGVSATLDDKAKWSVSGDSAYEFVNKQNTASNVNANLRMNAGYGFACYATTTGGALTLYKLSDNRTEVELSFAEDVFNFTTANYNSFDGQQVVSIPNVSAITDNITYSIAGSIGNIDSNTGQVTLNGTVGNAIVTASFVGDETYTSATASYTISVIAAPNRYIKATSIESGEKYLIVGVKNGSSYLATPIPSSKTYAYPAGYDVTSMVVDANTIEINDESDYLFTLTTSGTGYTIKQPDGRYIYASGSYATLNVGTTQGVWTFEKQNNDSYKITESATGDNTYIQFGQSTYTTFGRYSSDQTNASLPFLYVLDDGKVDPGISYTPASATVTFGETLAQPTLSNEHGLAVTYASDATGVATVASNGAISVVGAGSAKITASWAEQEINNVTYRAGSTSFNLTVSKATPTIAAFNNPTTSVAIGNKVTNTTTISNGLTITYSSNNTSAATVNAATGEVTGVANGTAVISATFAGNNNYNAAEPATYTITVGTGGTGFTPVTFSWSRNGANDSVTSGYALTTSGASSKSGYYQDNTGTVSLTIKKSNNGALFSTAPSTISLTVSLGAGTANAQFNNSAYACLIDADGNEITSTVTEISGSKTPGSTSGKDFSVSIPVVSTAYGVKVRHDKESGVNMRYFSISFSAN